MSIKFEVKMTEKVMYDFLLYHSYTSVTGLLGALIGVGFLVLAFYKSATGDTNSFVLFLFMAVIMLIMTPLSLKTTARNQVRNTKMFQEPLQYELSEEGVAVMQDGQRALNKWEEFAKVVSTGKSIVLYVTRVRAIVLPKESMGDDYMAVVEMISKKVAPKKVKIRHVK